MVGTALRAVRTVRAGLAFQRAYLQIIGRDLEGVAVGIAEINRVGNFVILELELDTARLQFVLCREKIFPVRAEREMKDPKTAVTRRR
jgi:hypothetical protein